MNEFLKNNRVLVEAMRGIGICLMLSLFIFPVISLKVFREINACPLLLMIIVSTIVGFILNAYGKSIEDEIIAENRRRVLLKKQEDIEQKIENWCKEKKILYSPAEQRTYINDFSIYKAKKDIIQIYNGADNEPRIHIYRFEDIEYYTHSGNLSYTNQVRNVGKNISVGGAIVGGLMAGVAGAVIGAGKDANKLVNETVEHDDRKSIFIYRKNGELMQDKYYGIGLYDWLSRELPEKNYDYVALKKEDIHNDDIKVRLTKIKNLLDEGLISEANYIQKKKEIMNDI